MAFSRRATLAASIIAVALSSAPSFAQQVQPPATYSQEDLQRIAQEIGKRLLSLPNYSVFDSLGFGIQGKTVILHGYASRPTLKSDAERAVKSIQGVAAVDNKIEVLPNSPMDDRIRAAVYNRIYLQPTLRKYNANQGSIGQAIGPGPNIAAMAGGITQSPPIGFHAIHIIVKGGHVTLTGVVNNKTDADIAYIQANGTPGVFSVDNDLRYPGAPESGAK